ncbi:MAG TPA: peptidase S41 [Cellvibrionales bacterium]|nr:peptidase S41 [Cellvibrionales bacterium]
MEASSDSTHTALMNNGDPKKGKMALDDLRAFVKAFNHIRSAYVEEVDDATLLKNAVKGMLSELDPHSNFLEPDHFKDLQETSTGEFGGLGLEVGMEDNFIKVISPIDDTPAQKAGIKTGDLIISIDGQPIKGLDLGEAVKKMRGPKGSEVTLSIIRKGVPQPIEFTLIRDIISVISVRSEILNDHYLYIRIAQFQGNTGVDLKNLLASTEKQPTIRGVVLDLRNNPGGILQAAVEVTDAFIEQGLIVYTEGRIKHSAMSYDASNHQASYDYPLVVLINGGSASASEIVAGALQDHQRALILGTTSFGKGSVQTVIPLSEKHGIKLTTARYFTPSGRSIQAQGIEPDIVVEPATITKIDTGKKYTEASLQGHLANGELADDQYSDDESDIHSTDQARLAKDNQLYEALNILKGLHILSLDD